jgi:hypothetical protein
MFTIKLSGQETAAVLDALRKGASRHESYAKFTPTSPKADDHRLMAQVMRDLHGNIERAHERYKRA